jgi:hypothetical protein
VDPVIELSFGSILKLELKLELGSIFRTKWNWNGLRGAGYGTGLKPPLRYGIASN